MAGPTLKPNRLASRNTQPSRLLPLLLRTALSKQAGTTAGISLLEALVAIILITIVVSIVTPPIFLSVATRVNNRRTEQAMQLAQAEIERVRLVMTGSQTNEEVLELVPKAVDGLKPDDIASVEAPSKLCTTAPPCAPDELAYAEPQLGEDQRFYVQSFRDPGAVINKETPDTDDDRLFAFRMGVRVYAADAANNLGSLKAKPRSSLFTTGTGGRGFAPLVVFYTELNRGSTPGGLVKLESYAE